MTSRSRGSPYRVVVVSWSLLTPAWLMTAVVPADDSTKYLECEGICRAPCSLCRAKIKVAGYRLGFGNDRWVKMRHQIVRARGSESRHGREAVRSREGWSELDTGRMTGYDVLPDISRAGEQAGLHETQLRRQATSDRGRACKRFGWVVGVK